MPFSFSPLFTAAAGEAEDFLAAAEELGGGIIDAAAAGGAADGARELAVLDLLLPEVDLDLDGADAAAVAGLAALELETVAGETGVAGEAGVAEEAGVELLLRPVRATGVRALVGGAGADEEVGVLVAGLGCSLSFDIFGRK